MLGLVAIEPVGFTAMKLHAGTEGTIYAHLINGQVFSYNRETRDTTVHLGGARFRDAFWHKDIAYLVDSTGLQRLCLRSDRIELVARLDNATKPLVLSGDEKYCFLRVAYAITQIDLLGENKETLHKYPLDYPPCAMLYTANGQLWVGGYELRTFDIAGATSRTVEKFRDIPYLSIAYDEQREIIAAAGSNLSLYSKDGVLLRDWGDSLFACHFTATGMLIVSGRLPASINAMAHIPRLTYTEECGVRVCTISTGNFLWHRTTEGEQLIVSHEGQLFFFE